jgi:hypothetical protein
MDFVTSMYLAKIRQEELRERSRAIREHQQLFLERSIGNQSGSRVKTIFSFVIILFALIALFVTTKAQETSQVLFVANETLISPGKAQSGYVQLALQNDSQWLASHELVRLADGVPAEEGIQAVKVMMRLEPGDLPQALGNFDTFYGGVVHVQPGKTKWVGTTLEPGTYVSYTTVFPEGEGRRVPVEYITSLIVEAYEVETRAPEATYAINITDEGFVVPEKVPGGNNLWRISNSAKTEHTAFIHKLKAGKTSSDVEAWLKEGLFDPSFERPVEDPGTGAHVLSSGYSNDVWLELSPGSYVVYDPSGLFQMFNVHN